VFLRTPCLRQRKISWKNFCIFLFRTWSYNVTWALKIANSYFANNTSSWLLVSNNQPVVGKNLIHFVVRMPVSHRSLFGRVLSAQQILQDPVQGFVRKQLRRWCFVEVRNESAPDHHAFCKEKYICKKTLKETDVHAVFLQQFFWTICSKTYRVGVWTVLLRACGTGLLMFGNRATTPWINSGPFCWRRNSQVGYHFACSTQGLSCCLQFCRPPLQ